MIDPDSPVAQKLPFSRGADSGLRLGLYFSAMFLTWFYASRLPLLSIVTCALAVALPVTLYRMLRRSLESDGGTTTVTNLWIEGIVGIAGGALLCAGVTMVFLTWVEPGFIVNQLGRMIELYDTTNDPSLAEAAEMSRRLIENGAVPKASTWTLAMWLFTVTSGSMLAGLMAVLAKMTRSRLHRRRGNGIR